MIERISIDTIEKICQCLLDCDPNIVEIIQFGSSVYAPKYAKDLDLLVITKGEKDYNVYLDSLDQLDLPFDVDIVVREIGNKLKSNFACQVLGSFKILYGDGKHLAEIAKDFNPTFRDAYDFLEEAREDLKAALGREAPSRKDIRIRAAFNSLFHASRIAAAAYLSTENARWGRIKRGLSQPYKDKFEEFINIKYFYNGDYPEKFEEEFKRWNKKVKDFVEDLEKKRL